MAQDNLKYDFYAEFAHAATHLDLIMQAADYASAASGVRNYLITVPAGVFPHLIYTVDSAVSTRVQFFEGTTVSAAGNAVITARLNRNGNRTTKTVITSAPTITLDGTELPGALTSANKGVAMAHDGAEWILKPDTLYLLRTTRLTSGVMLVKFEWYEAP